MELERWHRQQRLLTSIAEQLKSKDCKTVIGVLITCKSRLLKKWKIVDSRFVIIKYQFYFCVIFINNLCVEFEK